MDLQGGRVEGELKGMGIGVCVGLIHPALGTALHVATVSVCRRDAGDGVHTFEPNSNSLFSAFNFFHDFRSDLPLLPRVHVASRAHANPASRPGPVAGQDAGQVVLVHEVLLPRAALLVARAYKLLLVLGEDQVLAPAVLAAGVARRVAVQAAVGGAVDRLGHAVDVAAVVPLEVALEVQPECALVVGGAAGAQERGLSARRAELARHVAGDGEAAVAAEHPRLELGDAGHGGRHEVEVHAQRYVLHGVIGGEDGGLQRLLRGGLGGRGGVGVLGLVLLEVGGCDPAIFVVVVFLLDDLGFVFGSFLQGHRLVGLFTIFQGNLVDCFRRIQLWFLG